MGGGGVVVGQEYSESQCMLKALAFDDTNSDAWCNLGSGDGGDVGGQHYPHAEPVLCASQSRAYREEY